MGPFGDGVVHTNLPAVHLSPIQSIFSLRSIILNRKKSLKHLTVILMSVAYQVLKIDEGKASAAAGVTVKHHLNLLEGPELLELCLELPLVGVEAQTEHTEALAGLRIISVTLMPPPEWIKVTMKASNA